MSTRSKPPAQTCSTTSSARSQRWQPAATNSRTLGIETSRHGRLGDALHREPVGGHPHARSLLLLRHDRLLEGAGDDVVEPLVHLFLLPEVLLEPLHPLEIGDDDAARIREHVREDEDAPVLEDLVGGRRDRAVRALADDTRLHVGRVLVRDHLLERARGQHVALEQQELVVGDRVGGRVPLEHAVLGLPREDRRHVEPRRGVDAAARVGDSDDDNAALVEQTREVAADVAEALDDDAQAIELLVLLCERVRDYIQRAAGGRLLASERAADREWLPGDDAEDRVALVHGVGVEDPGHDARVSADVGRRDVLLRADLVDDLGRVAACQALQLAPREPLRVAHHAALGAAEGQAHEGALPGHVHRERLHLVARHRRVVADAALRGAARDVVGDAVAAKDTDGAVVHRHRNRDLDGLLALLEDADQVRVDPERLPDAAKLLARELERVLTKMCGGFGRGHRSLLLSRPGRSLPLCHQRIRKATVSASAGPSGGFATTRSRYGPFASGAPRGPRPVSPKAYRPGSTSRSRATSPSRSRPRHSSTSRSETGRSWRRPARSRTCPAWTVSTAGALSEARKARAESWTPPIRAEPFNGSATAHGTTMRPPPATSSRPRPWIAPTRRGRNARRAVSFTVALLPGARRTRVGTAVTARPAIPSVAASTSTRMRREETLRRVIRRAAVQPALSAAPKATAAGSETTSAAAAAKPSSAPAPCADGGLIDAGTLVPTRAPLRARASSSGLACASAAAAPPASAAAALVPLIVA